MSPPREITSGAVARGRIRVPPSKSISHRYFNLTLLSQGSAAIDSPLEAEDLVLFGRCLEQLGFRPQRRGSTLLWSRDGEVPRAAEIDCGNAGTMYRFLTASLTTLEGDWLLTGKPRLFERPVGALVDTLRALGGRIDCLGAEGFGPLRIRGGTLEGGSVAIDASESSQYVSAVLMAACRARGPVELEVSRLASSPYLDLTLEALETFGGAVERLDGERFRVLPSALRAPEGLCVEGDYSAATYPAAAALLTDGRVLLEGLREASSQGDRRFVDLLVRMGAHAEWDAEGLVVGGTPGEALEVDLASMPDQVPTLAALAPFLRGTTSIRNVAHLRIKESDRLAVMARELTRAGATVRELEDGLVIEGTWAVSEPPSNEVEVDPEDDHRIAMAMALLGLRRPGIKIRDPEVVGKSYPHFWRDLDTLLG